MEYIDGLLALVYSLGGWVHCVENSAGEGGGGCRAGGE
jgi:hypothetical protein